MRGEKRVRTVSIQAGKILFGDRVGLAVFLGAVLWCGTLWRVGIFIQDTVTVANALANVANGHMAILDSPYALSLGSQPGLVEVGGRAYGRNYGHVFLALPLLWVLEGLTLLADLHLLIAGGWSLGLVAFASQASRITGRERLVTIGSGVALVVFVGNVLAAVPIPDGLLALVALQLSTILLAALLAATLYRLVSRFHGRRVGVVAGATAVVATPVGFWASIPKRHVLTACVAVVALYCFAVSRESTNRRSQLARASSYGVIGLLTTVHPFEAFFLFVVLVPLDVVTAPSNSVRSVGLISAVFFCSLLPFFIINTLISGNPLQSPRLLSGYASEIGVPTDSTNGDSGGSGSGGTDGGGSNGGTTGTEGSGSSGGDSSGSGNGSGDGGSTGGGGATSSGDGDGSTGNGTSPVGVVVGLVAGIIGFAGSVFGFAADWIDSSTAVLGETERLYRTFVRSGQISGRLNDYEAIELTLLESFPLVAALLWLPVATVQNVRGRLVSAGLDTPHRQTDLLAVGFAVVCTFVYLPKLPLHSQITVRYILPVMPLLLYGVMRLSAVHRTIEAVPKWLVGSYLVTVVGGGALLLVALVALDPAIGEAMQLHALVGLAAAVILTVGVLLWPAYEDRRAIAVGLAVPAGMTTVFLLVAKIEYFSYRIPSADAPNLYALDVLRVVAELLPVFPA